MPIDFDEKEFDEMVDSLLLNAVIADITSFDDLVESLPGVYPTVVLKALERLTSSGKISEEVLMTVQNYIKLPNVSSLEQTYNNELIKLPIPHPLDYEWRFGNEAIKFLLGEVSKVLLSNSKLVLLGTPSILQFIIENKISIPTILLDKNEICIEAFIKAGYEAFVNNCDFAVDKLPKVNAQVAILDPPWYEEHKRLFTWIACNLCVVGGFIFISIPPEGTRPGCKVEIENYISWAEDVLKLKLIKFNKSILPYQSPLFEINALKASGINNISENWRRGDLLIFKTTAKPNIARPLLNQIFVDGVWNEVNLFGTRFRVRESKENNNFLNPMLKSIVEGDVFPSVSRRDERRKLVDVWTSGNRVYSCEDKKSLLIILNSLLVGESAKENIATMLNRDLSKDEVEIVSNTEKIIMEIHNYEQYERQIKEGY